MKPVEKWNAVGACLCLLIASGLSFFRISLHSDVLFLDDLFTDLAAGGSWIDWKFSPAPSYFPDMLLYGIGYSFLPNPMLRIFFLTVCQALLLGGLGVWVARKIRPEISHSAQAMIIALAAFVALVAVRTHVEGCSIGIFFNANNIQVPSLLSSLLVLGLLLDFAGRPRVTVAAAIVAFGALAHASSAVFMLCFVAPALACFVGLLALSRAGKRPWHSTGVIAMTMGVLVLSQACGWALNSLITYNEPLKSFNRVPFTREAAQRSFDLFWNATLRHLTASNPFALGLTALCVLSLVCFTVVSVRSLAQFFSGRWPFVRFTLALDGLRVDHDWRLWATAMFLAFAIPAVLIGSIASGGFNDLGGYRYYMFALVLTLIMGVVFIDRYLARIGNDGTALCSPLVIAVYIMCYGTYVWGLDLVKGQSLADLLHHGSHQVGTEYQIAQCLNDLERSGVPLRGGVADFWAARGIATHLNKPTVITATLNNLDPFFCASTIGPMIHPEQYATHPRYNFAVIRTPDGGGAFNYSRKTIGRVLPPGYTIYPCPGTDAEVWVYTGDELDSAVHEAFDRLAFSKQMRPSAIWQAQALPVAAGETVGTERVANSPAHQGVVTHGPYATLSAGQWKIKVGYSGDSTSAAPVGFWEVGRFSVPDNLVVLHKADLRSTPLGSEEAVVTVPAGGLENLEIRTWFNGQGQMTVKTVEIERVDAAYIAVSQTPVATRK